MTDTETSNERTPAGPLPHAGGEDETTALVAAPDAGGEIAAGGGDDGGEKPPPMNEDQARTQIEKINGVVNRIDRDFGELRRLIWELDRREGWKALGYQSWRACVLHECARSQSQLYRERDAAMVELIVSPRGEIGTIPERHLRPLVALKEADDRKTTWDRAQEIAEERGEDLAQRHVRDAVRELNERLAPAVAREKAANGEEALAGADREQPDEDAPADQEPAALGDGGDGDQKALLPVGGGQEHGDPLPAAGSDDQTDDATDGISILHRKKLTDEEFAFLREHQLTLEEAMELVRMVIEASDRRKVTPRMFVSEGGGGGVHVTY